MLLDSFGEGPTVTAKTTYEQFRADVLKIGRFSCFEASATNLSARFYDRLCRDPEVEVTKDLGYPWTGVKWKKGAVTQQAESTTEPPFLVGDIVRCIAADARDPRLIVGFEYHVIGLSGTGDKTTVTFAREPLGFSQRRNCVGSSKSQYP